MSLYVKDYYYWVTGFSDNAYSLTSEQKECVKAVAQAGGGNLYVTSTLRKGGQHGLGRAVDFGNRENLPLLLSVFEKLRQSWPGAVGLGIDKADRHLHVDARHLDKNYDKTRGAVAFFELDKPACDDCSVPVVSFYREYDPAFHVDRVIKFEQTRARAAEQYGMVGLPALNATSAGWTGTVTVGAGGLVIGLAQGLKSGLLDYEALGPKRAAINAIPSVVVPTVAGALMGRAVDLAYAAIKKLF